MPDSTAPKNPARKYTDADRQAVIDARVALKQQGLHYGPMSVHYHLFDPVGPDRTPSRPTIAAWLNKAGLVDANAQKRPRSSDERLAGDYVCGELRLRGPLPITLTHSRTGEQIKINFVEK